MTSELLERDAELAEIAGLVGRAASASGGLLVLEGAAGCGKTRLLQEVRRQAERAGTRILFARGGELERGFPFGVARQLFEQPLAAVASHDRQALFAGAAALAPRALGLDAAPEDPTDDDRLFPALHGLYWLTVNLAERAPLAILIDDLQWSDAMTLRWLGYLVQRIDGLPVLVAVAVRAGEPRDDARLLESISGHERAHTLRPTALTVDAVAALVTQRLGPGDAAFAKACHDATAGNPFMLSELLGVLAADGVAPDAAGAARVHRLGPATVARSVFLRLARLPRGADALVRTVAVLGLDAELRHAAALARLDERTAARAADALAAAAILAPGRPLEFVHPVVRAAVYDELPVEQRALHHRDAARLLAGESADPQRVAAHLRCCRPAGDSETVRLLRQAAQAAQGRGATADAIADLRRALEEPPALDQRGELLLELGTAERHANDTAAAEHLELAAAAISDHRLRSLALRELSRALTNTGRMGGAVDAVDRAVRTLDGRDVDLAREIEAELIATGQMGMLPGYSVAERIARLGAARVDPSTPGGRMLHAVLAFEAMRKARPSETAAQLAERALQAGATLEPVVDSAPRYLALLTLLYAERFDQVQRRCEDELAGVLARGSASEFSVVSVLVADVAFRRGRLADAESHALSVLGIEAVEGTLARGLALSTQVACLLERGSHAAAAAVLTAAGVDDLAPELLLHSLLHARGQSKIARGDTRAGLDDLEACGRLLTAAGFENSAPVPWRPAAALAHASLHASAEAELLAGEELERARSFGAPRVLGMALRTAGLLRGGPAGVELLEEAVAVLATSEAGLEHARALTDFGAALRRAGHDVNARAPLRSGLELAHACDASALAARARDELVAAGARPRRVALSGVRSLTPSERRVAQLAAQGLGNHEIAQTLFVTVKTIETHLGHIYAKLGITSRTALPHELDEADGSPAVPR